MYFQYDTSGVPLGFIHNDTQYFYITNQMGDVMGITDADGNKIAEYTYDDWGKLLSIKADDENFAIAESNPLRYRGYYYDNETGYYYLQSRYYDANICRFINADVPEITKVSKEVENGVNIFAYCNNDSVNNSDPTGLIKWDNVFGNISILTAVLSAIGTLSLVAFRHTPWGKALSLCITLGSLASNIYSYTKAIKSARSYYGKKSSNYKSLLKYNNIVLAANVAFIVVSEILGKAIVRKYSLTIAYALIKVRTITIVGLSINIAEIVSGKNVMYRSRRGR